MREADNQLHEEESSTVQLSSSRKGGRAEDCMRVRWKLSFVQLVLEVLTLCLVYLSLLNGGGRLDQESNKVTLQESVANAQI